MSSTTITNQLNILMSLDMAITIIITIMVVHIDISIIHTYILVIITDMVLQVNTNEDKEL